MAGLGKKTFIAGEVLTASEVNGYLMDQSVMRFASSSARATALPSPDEGMVSYLDDTNKVEVYDGSSWGAVSADPVPFATALMSSSFSVSVPPYADGSTGTIATFTFPAGRFSVPPVVLAQTVDMSAGLSNYAKWAVTTISASAVTFFLMNAGPSSAVAGGGNMTQAQAYVHAMQYSSGSATG